MIARVLAAVAALFLSCSGYSPLETCLQDCHYMTIAGCGSEHACLVQCHAGDYLSVAIQYSQCPGVP